MALEGTTEGASVRLWNHELPNKFEYLKLGQKIQVRKGPFAGQTLRIVGKLHNRYDKFVYCVSA